VAITEPVRDKCTKLPSRFSFKAILFVCCNVEDYANTRVASTRKVQNIFVEEFKYASNAAYRKYASHFGVVLCCFDTKYQENAVKFLDAAIRKAK
jgi:hypothetical protein